MAQELEGEPNTRVRALEPPSSYRALGFVSPGVGQVTAYLRGRRERR